EPASPQLCRACCRVRGSSILLDNSIYRPLPSSPRARRLRSFLSLPGEQLFGATQVHSSNLLSAEPFASERISHKNLSATTTRILLLDFGANSIAYHNSLEDASIGAGGMRLAVHSMTLVQWLSGGVSILASLPILLSGPSLWLAASAPRASLG